MWVAQSPCLQYKVSQLRCQSAYQKHSSEEPGMLTVQVTQGSLPLSSPLSFQLSLSPFQLPQAMPTTLCPPFTWTYFQTVCLSRESHTVSLMTVRWETLCFSQQGTVWGDLCLHKARLASLDLDMTVERSKKGLPGFREYIKVDFPWSSMLEQTCSPASRISTARN